jgi:hypothetical protein
MSNEGIFVVHPLAPSQELLYLNPHLGILSLSGSFWYVDHHTFKPFLTSTVLPVSRRPLSLY